VDNASIQTKVSLQVDRKTNRNVWDRVVEREEPVSSKSVTDVVQSLEPELTARGERDGCGNRQVSGRPALIGRIALGTYNPGVRPAVCSSSAQANRYPKLACRYSACAL